MNSILALGLFASRARTRVEAALVETDGADAMKVVHESQIALSSQLNALLVRVCEIASRMDRPAPDPDVNEASSVLTQFLLEAHRSIIRQSGISPSTIEIGGIYGYTIAEFKIAQQAWQIGNMALLARDLGLKFFGNFQPRKEEDPAHGFLPEEASLDASAIAYCAARRLRLSPVFLPAAGGGLVAMDDGETYLAGEKREF